MSNKILGVIEKISYFVIIICLLFSSMVLCNLYDDGRKRIDVTQYPVSIDYGGLSSKEKKLFNEILYAIDNNIECVDTTAYSSIDKSKMVQTLGLYYGTTEDIYKLFSLKKEHILLNLELFKKFTENKCVIDARIDEALSTLYEGSDRYKLYQISNYIAKRITYTKGHRDVMGALNGKGVCNTYAILFCKMARRLGIQASYVKGYTDEGNGEYHAWNVVKLDGEIYHYDITAYDSSGYNPRYLHHKSCWDYVPDEIVGEHFNMILQN